MNRYYSVIFAMLLIMCSNSLTAGTRDVVSEHYSVNGVCGQCKERIESAAYIRGVKYANWNIDTHLITLKYDTTKASFRQILQHIAKAGHDSEYYLAEDKDYDRVAPCCKYRSGLKKH